MTWLDMMVLGLVGGSFVKGWRDGFIRQVAALGALLAAIYGCTKVALLLRGLILSAGWASERSVTFVSYIGAFILILAAVRLAGRWVEHGVAVGPLSLINHLTGALCAASFALFIISFTLNLAARAREAILNGTFPAFRAEFNAKFVDGPARDA